jgi:hypothetical protein
MAHKRDEELELAHKESSYHKEDIKASNLCGCFYCRRMFNPKTKVIVEWIDGGETALCPYCGIDSVIALESGFPITKAFLKRMSDYWFSIAEDIEEWHTENKKS